MYFLVTGVDKPGVLEQRLAIRQRHIDYWLGLGEAVKLGGPLLATADAAADPKASVLVIEAAGLDEARAIADADPFATDGVFAEVRVEPMRLTLGAWLPA